MFSKRRETQPIAELLVEIDKCDLPAGAENLSKPRGFALMMEWKL